MGSIEFGAPQNRSIGFYDPADSGVVNRRGMNVQERGIYVGGYLTKVSDASASVSVLVCVIGDNDYQLRISTGSAATISGVSSTNKYIVLRWSYTGSAATDYMDILAIPVGSIQANDLIVGVCVYSGATLVGFDYGDSSYPRSEPLIMSLVGRVEAQQTPGMYVRVRALNVNYGSVNYRVSSQLVGPFTAPSVNPRIDLVYIDTDGTVKTSVGTESATPVAPDYGGRIALAEIRLGAGATSITNDMIRDVRGFVGGGSGGGGGASYPDLFLMCGA